MFAPHQSVASSTRVPGGQWQDGHDQRRRPSTTSSNDNPAHSSHLRMRSTAQDNQSAGRFSAFSGRSRSNTTTSTSASRPSPASTMTSTDVSSLRSQAGRSFSTAGLSIADKSEKRSFFSRGSRILRRRGSKFSVSATLDEADEGDRDKKFEVSEFFSRHRSRQSDAHEQIKRIISGPFDFHHVTHTSAAQFQALDNASNNELVTEFSAIRASQRPDTELKGIRAEEIHFRDFSSENLWNSGAASKAGESRSSSPPLSPRASPSRRSSESPRGSRGIENFSPPGSRHQTAPGSPSIIPPPRVSSKQACSDISEPAPPALDELLGLHTQQTYPDFVYPNSDDEADEVSSLARINLAEIFQPDVGHAVTTADDSTRFTRRPSTIPNPSDLEDVPEEEEEEEEATFWRESPEHSSRPSTSHSSRLDHPPSAVPSSSNTGAPDSNLSLRVPEHLSSRFSDTLASPTLPHLVPESPIPQAQDLRRKFPACGKSVINDVSESWDADIDYCYEHAAESNCNFDWHRSSLDEADDTVPGVSLTVADSPDKPGDGDRNRTQHPLGTSPHGFATPELEPGSTQSLFTSHEAVTPLTAGDEVDFITESKQTVQGDYFKPIHTHILSSTSLGKEMTPDTLYEEYLAGDGESDRHFPFYSQRDSQSLDHPVSPRSSIYSPLSECNSQESIILSRAASIARKHRSSVSTLSVPELVHSASSSREYTFQENPAPVEQSTSATLGQTPSYPNSSSAAATKADGPPSAARKQSIASDKGFNGKKTRTSYSLFPSRTGSQRPL